MGFNTMTFMLILLYLRSKKFLVFSEKATSFYLSPHRAARTRPTARSSALLLFPAEHLLNTCVSYDKICKIPEKSRRRHGNQEK